jgi:hypothetical protein
MKTCIEVDALVVVMVSQCSYDLSEDFQGFFYAWKLMFYQMTNEAKVVSSKYLL